MFRSTLLVLTLAVLAACGDDPYFPFLGDAAPVEDADDAGTDSAEDTPDAGEDPGTARDTGSDSADVPDDPLPGSLGADCQRNSDCDSEICVPVGAGRNVCSRECGGAGCPAGWTCDAAESVCGCTAAAETCNGLDDDCDGRVDEGSATSIGCAPSEACIDAVCQCPPSSRACDGVCVNAMRDPDNCGGCGVECPDGISCVDGECGCSGGLERCEGECVDTDADPANCGGCGVSCGRSGVCVEGACSCPGGFETCPVAGCTDTSTDSDNCGGCGVACAVGTACVDGECGCPCPGAACELGTCVVLGGTTTTTLPVALLADPQRADIAISMDTTGSMGSPIAALQRSLSSTIFPAAVDAFSDVAFAISSYDDFPCGGFGTGSDRPFILYQRATTDIAAAQAGVAALERHNGSDTPESAIEALFQIATGSGRDEAGCIAGPEVAAFDPSANRVAGVADGVLGGVGFRDGSLPIVVKITDAPTQARGESGYPYGATRDEAYAALDGIGARTVGVAVGAGGRAFLVDMATRTGSLVPPCAWGEGAGRPAACSVSMCCTGASGAGVSPVEGRCPLVFDVQSTGTGLDRSVVDGIRILSRFSPFDVRVRVRGDAAVRRDTGIDTACLVRRIEVTGATGGGAGGCGPVPTPVDTDSDGVLDSVDDVIAGVEVGAVVSLDSSCIARGGVYPVHLELVAGEAAALGSTVVYVLVGD